MRTIATIDQALRAGEILARARAVDHHIEDFMYSAIRKIQTGSLLETDENTAMILLMVERDIEPLEGKS